MALELRAEKITFASALGLACVHAVMGWNWDSLTVLAGAIFFLLAGLKQAYLILTSVLPQQELAETRIRRWKLALGWVLLMGGILLVAIWEMCCAALDQWNHPEPLRSIFWPGLGLLAATMGLQGAIFVMKRRSPGSRFVSPWMGLAPLVTLLSMTGFAGRIPGWGEAAAVWAMGLISLAALVLLVRECLTHSFRSIRSVLLLES